MLWACDDSAENNLPESKIIYKNLNDVRAGYNSSYLLDINGDGIGEYLFTVVSIGVQNGTETHFKIHPTQANRLMTNQQGFPIVLQEGVAVEGQSFEKLVEPMIIKSTSENGTTWLGYWKDAQPRVRQSWWRD